VEAVRVFALAVLLLVSACTAARESIVKRYRDVADPSRHGDTRNRHGRTCTYTSVSSPAAIRVLHLQATVRTRPTPYTILRVMMATGSVFLRKWRTRGASPNAVAQLGGGCGVLCKGFSRDA
jgi:hypothetical protein